MLEQWIDAFLGMLERLPHHDSSNLIFQHSNWIGHSLRCCPGHSGLMKLTWGRSGTRVR